MAQTGTMASMTDRNAVKSAGTTTAGKVVVQLKKMKINDPFAKGGSIRADAPMVHDMYVMRVKSPQESKYLRDYYWVVKAMSGEEALSPITGPCPLAPKWLREHTLVPCRGARLTPAGRRR
jgi:branched-chain amino acid transport system substrate-binding protein